MMTMELYILCNVLFFSGLEGAVPWKIMNSSRFKLDRMPFTQDKEVQSTYPWSDLPHIRPKSPIAQ